MSIKKLIIFASFTILLLGGYILIKPALPKSSMQFPTFAGGNQSIYSNRGIVDRIVQVDLDYKNSINGSQEITAEISLPFDFKGQLEIKWTLGENVVLVSGLLTDTIAELKAGATQKIKLQVSGFTKFENRHISFEIMGQKNGRVIYGESLLASQLENTFEHIVQNVERIKASRMEKPRE